MIEATIADVICPAVATDDPDAFLDQYIGHAFEITEIMCHFGRTVCLQQLVQTRFQLCDAIALATDSRVVDLVRKQQCIDQLHTDHFPVLTEQIRCSFNTLIGATRIPIPNSALSSKANSTSAGPRPSAFCDHGVVGRLPP